MTRYRVISTLVWQFDSDQDYQHCLDKARNQLDHLIVEPNCSDYEKFQVQLEVAKIKNKRKVRHVKEFLDEEFFDLLKKSEQQSFTDLSVENQVYRVRIDSDRYRLFQKNKNCVACGLIGNRFFLDINPGDFTPHFNLYGEENGRLVLMTKDHILPKSKGGENVLHNYQTMCSICNNLKGNYDLTAEEIFELRTIHKNKDKLPQKELKEIINNKREELAAPITIIIQEVL